MARKKIFYIICVAAVLSACRNGRKTTSEVQHSGSHGDSEPAPSKKLEAENAPKTNIKAEPANGPKTSNSVPDKSSGVRDGDCNDGELRTLKSAKTDDPLLGIVAYGSKEACMTKKDLNGSESLEAGLRVCVAAKDIDAAGSVAPVSECKEVRYENKRRFISYKNLTK